MADHTASERVRRWRRRRREGLSLAQSEVPEEIVESLVEAGHIDASGVADPKRLGAALLKVVREVTQPQGGTV